MTRNRDEREFMVQWRDIRFSLARVTIECCTCTHLSAVFELLLLAKSDGIVTVSIKGRPNSIGLACFVFNKAYAETAQK